MYYAKVANNNGNDNTNYTNDKAKQPSGTRQKADSAPEGFLAKKRERDFIAIEESHLWGNKTILKILSLMNTACKST